MDVDVKNMTPEEGAEAAIKAVRELVAETGLSTDLKEWKISEDDLPTLAEKAMQDSQMCFNPRPPEEEEILEIYRKLI
jgi:alcohol dehydrogenase